MLPVAALFSGKARLLLIGRRDSLRRIRNYSRPKGRLVWFHCASLGEFEQARPVIEGLKNREPQTSVVITFFSPSGYEIRKEYAHADTVFYLPSDTDAHARLLMDKLAPDAVVFVKYEFWYYFLKTAMDRSIPVYLLSAVFREGQNLFRWHGAFLRPLLAGFSSIWVQNEASMAVVKDLSLNNIRLTGDTRFDRVLQMMEGVAAIPQMEKLRDRPVLVAGSSWPAEEQLAKEALVSMDGQLSVVIVPHDVSPQNVNRIVREFSAWNAITWSQFENSGEWNGNVVVMDRIGLLGRLYRFADFVIIGGGFGKGLHNMLEAAVYGKPLCFGPAIGKHWEAAAGIQAGFCRVVNNGAELTGWITERLRDHSLLEREQKAASAFVIQNSGATETVLAELTSESVK